MMNLVPTDKKDVETAEAAVRAGYPAVEPILKELLAWLQDCNWPVARVLAPFLADIGSPLIPYIDAVFATDDEMWKYWLIVCLIGENGQLVEHYREDLVRIGHNPNGIERHNELDEAARDALGRFGAAARPDGAIPSNRG